MIFYFYIGTHQYILNAIRMQTQIQMIPVHIHIHTRTGTHAHTYIHRYHSIYKLISNHTNKRSKIPKQI